MQLDRYDIHILQILHQQGRITKSGLAEAISLSVSPCWERVKRLEQAGIIEGYGARINADVLFKRTPVLVEVSLKQHSAEAFQRFEQAMQTCEQVVDCYATGGGVDYILRVMCDGIDQYQRLIDHWLESNIGIERYFTYIVTKTIKQQPPGLEFDSQVLA
ncbi:Lrp/AsnC family transcriptional regulator [Oceanisphaera arctica]|uniref:AsnC family transcriptional regulator n=1 Tax=Oceanisphaera arctica TaxID=641510 RepID=A0A2P5TP76_9GAMM|nr:Lrp/AsnC family transcriptional regulator [Oceanisphaera arctica]PPL17415.1 AsnC family transcriptional regulator [Oceanisphaera arctica]GHA08209.1 transcriptional regulator [Oceanisphaera arctica]